MNTTNNYKKDDETMKTVAGHISSQDRIIQNLQIAQTDLFAHGAANDINKEEPSRYYFHLQNKTSEGIAAVLLITRNTETKPNAISMAKKELVHNENLHKFIKNHPVYSQKYVSPELLSHGEIIHDKQEYFYRVLEHISMEEKDKKGSDWETYIAESNAVSTLIQDYAKRNQTTSVAREVGSTMEKGLKFFNKMPLFSRKIAAEFLKSKTDRFIKNPLLSKQTNRIENGKEAIKRIIGEEKVSVLLKNIHDINNSFPFHKQLAYTQLNYGRKRKIEQTKEENTKDVLWDMSGFTYKSAGMEEMDDLRSKAMMQKEVGKEEGRLYKELQIWFDLIKDSFSDEQTARFFMINKLIGSMFEDYGNLLVNNKENWQKYVQKIGNEQIAKRNINHMIHEHRKTLSEFTKEYEITYNCS